MAGLYLYALLGERPGRSPGRGLRRERLRFLTVGGFVVAASAMRAPPPPSVRALRAHDATVRRLGRVSEAVLPVRFGTLVADGADLARRMAPQAAGLRAALALVAGREQMTLRLYRPSGRASSPGPTASRTTGRGRPGTRYLLGRAGERVAPEIEPLRPVLRGLVHAERVERHAIPPLVVSVYHLVDRGRSRAYATAVRRAARRLGGLRVRTSGPWPPYAFAPRGLA